MQSVVVADTFATTFLAYFAYLMHSTYKSREVTREINKKYYKNAIMYVLGVLLLFNIFIVGYDFGTDTYEHTFLPNGHCSFFVPLEYNTVRLLYAYSYFNEIIQILLLVASFVYYYKLNKMLTIVHHMPSTNDKQRNRLYLRIAIMMAASIGISRLSFSSSWYFNNKNVLHMARLFFSYNNV